jgi:hypothetical protein
MGNFSDIIDVDNPRGCKGKAMGGVIVGVGVVVVGAVVIGVMYRRNM